MTIIDYSRGGKWQCGGVATHMNRRLGKGGQNVINFSCTWIYKEILFNMHCLICTSNRKSH